MLTTSFQTRDFRARADREVTVLVAEANSRSEGIAAKATPSPIPFSPTPSIVIAISSLSTERSRPIRRALLLKTHECCSSQILNSFSISAVKREGLKAIQHRSSLQENHVPRGAARPARPDGDVGHGSLNRPMSHARQEMSVLVDKWRSGARRRAR